MDLLVMFKCPTRRELPCASSVGTTVSQHTEHSERCQTATAVVTSGWYSLEGQDLGVLIHMCLQLMPLAEVLSTALIDTLRTATLIHN